MAQYRVACYPGSADARVGLGDAFRESGKPDKARECFKQALALAPGHTVAISRLKELGPSEKEYRICENSNNGGLHGIKTESASFSENLRAVRRSLLRPSGLEPEPAGAGEPRKEYWKKWPGLYEFNKKNQARYIAEPGAALLGNKTKQ